MPEKNQNSAQPQSSSSDSGEQKATNRGFAAEDLLLAPIKPPSSTSEHTHVPPKQAVKALKDPQNASKAILIIGIGLIIFALMVTLISMLAGVTIGIIGIATIGGAIFLGKKNQ